MTGRLAIAVVALCLALPVQAARVIALSPHLAELVCAAGACDQLVGVVKYSDYPEHVRSVPVIGDAHAANVEAVLALKPDLILSWDGGTPARTVQQLERFKLRVVPIRVKTLDDVGLALLRIGALLGTEDAACAEQSRYLERIAALRKRYANAAPISVLYQIEPDPIFTINRDSPISEALGVCGASNLFADIEHLAGPVGRESVLARDPGAIVFGQQDDVAGIQRGWARFPGMRAVRASNLVPVNADKLERAAPRMAEGIAELCEALDAARGRLGKRSP